MSIKPWTAYRGNLRDFIAQSQAAGLDMARVQRAAEAVGATLVGDEIIMDPAQKVVFDWIMEDETPPPA